MLEYFIIQYFNLIFLFFNYTYSFLSKIAVKKKTKAVAEINEITGDLSKEIKDCLKTYKKCKDRVKDMKSIINV